MDYCELFLLRSLKTRKSSESSIGTDIEKAQTFSLQSLHSESEDHSSSTDEIQESKYHRWATSIRGLETRGIGPVPIAERHKDGDNGSASLSMALLWFSMTLATNDIIVGSIGTLVLELSFRDAALCAVFGNLLGAVAVGYISVWGPRSGNRTLIVTRYFVGYYPAKVCVVIDVLVNLTYCMLNSVVGGQILAKVSEGNVSVVVGIVIVSLASFVMATFGIRLFQFYERYVWLPQLMTFCIMLGSAGRRFNLQGPSVGSFERVIAKRLTFFSLCLSVSLAWAPLAADYYVYYPPSIKPWRTCLMTVLGSSHAMIITLLLGAGLGTAVANTPQWQKTYDGTPGSLLVSAYSRLGGFGKFCAVVNVLGMVANNAPGAYSMAMNFQMLGDFWLRIPRPAFTILTTMVYTACAMGGRDSLYEIFKNFLSLVGYWIVIWLVIVVEEDVLFNRGKEYDWSAWNNRQMLPAGIAAGMDQVYYTGPIANLLGGCDLGVWLAAGFTAVVFPPLRMLEVSRMGR